MHRFLGILAVLLLGWAVLTTVSSAQEETGEPVTQDIQVESADSQPKEATEVVDEVGVIETDFGVMVVEFFDDIAPNHVARFKELAREGFYDNTAFHRIVQGFMIQGGNPETKIGDKPRAVPPLKAEFNDRPHVRGTLSAARTNDPNSATSQFFLCLERNRSTEFLDGKYTNYGQLIAGEDVLMKLGSVETKMNPFGERSEPVQRAAIKRVYITSREEGLKAAQGE